MATTDLKLEDIGTLTPPRTIGRLVRFIFGGLSLYYVHGIWSVRDSLITEDGRIETLIWNGLLPGLFLISYVINIGYSRDWKKKPAIASAFYLVALAVTGWQVFGDWEGVILATGIAIWEAYLFLHLGICFVLAAIIRTPGCEMRALHHLYGLLTNTDTKEHHCPVGPLSAIDRWERNLKN